MEKAYQYQVLRDIQAQKPEEKKDLNNKDMADLMRRQADLARWEAQIKRDAEWLQ